MWTQRFKYYKDKKGCKKIHHLQNIKLKEEEKSPSKKVVKALSIKVVTVEREMEEIIKRSMLIRRIEN